jgi:hypothetical protein
MSSEWVRYDGKGQPVPNNVLVDVMLVNEIEFGRVASPGLSQDWDWAIAGNDGDIIAYRVVSAPVQTLTGETYLTALETDSPLMTNTPIKGMSCCIKGVYTVEFKDNKPVRMTWEASDAN